VFLDRDGTLVRDRGYVHRVEDYELLPGVISRLRRLRDAGFGLAIVTNQSGIGRGYFSEAQFHAFQARLLEDLARAGLRVEATYFCPHRPEEGCRCRKPAPGLLERAARELDVDLAASWVIGDSPADVGLAAAAGCRALRVGSGGAPSDAAAASARDLEHAAEEILGRGAAIDPLSR
jgi:D-glycero-D-manno-heptose 1,7-bisphosphate phosphatase